MTYTIVERTIHETPHGRKVYSAVWQSEDGYQIHVEDCGGNLFIHSDWASPARSSIHLKDLRKLVAWANQHLEEAVEQVGNDA